MDTVREKTSADVANMGSLPSFGERYVPLHKLAEGGMAEVFLARDAGQVPPKLVVIKRILPLQAKNPEYLKMFHDEGRLASAMSHPNIVKVFEVARAASGPFIVMEYLAGQDLFDLSRRAKRSGSFLPWQLAVAVAAQAAEGVAYSHQLKANDGSPLNIIHRDLTPSNIFVTWDGLVKVLDFGIARAEQRMAKTQVGMVKGKAQYLAPEQITGSAIDGRVDQFSLAAVLFEILCGRVMFKADNELAALNAILEGKRPSLVDFRPDIPVEVDAVILRATEISADRRFTDMKAFAEALRGTLGTDEISRESIALPMRQLFAAEFDKHAELMGKLQAPAPDTDELRQLYKSARANDGVDLPPLPTDFINTSKANEQQPTNARPEWLKPLLFGVLALALLVVGVRALRKPQVIVPKGALTLRTDPPGAQVILDGKPTAWTTPFVLDTLTYGKHHVEVKHPSRRPFTADFTLSAEKPAETIETALPRLPGKLTLIIFPPEARVSIDGRPVRLEGGRLSLPDVTVGETHKLIVAATGFLPKEQLFETKAEEPTTVQLSLESTNPSGPSRGQ